MSSQIGRQNGGFVVAIPGTRDSGQPLPQWSFRHFETKEEALEAAEGFVNQTEGFEAFVMPAEAYFYNPFKPKGP
jgi:hypothetical protein